jgi:hypothetical protein
MQLQVGSRQDRINQAADRQAKANATWPNIPVIVTVASYRLRVRYWLGVCLAVTTRAWY